MFVTIVSATTFEIAPAVQYLKEHFDGKDLNFFQKEKLKIRVLITGVGMPLTALQLGLYLAQEQPNLLINAGVAGAFNGDMELGSVFNVVADQFGDIGAEEADGSFTDIHEMGLIAPDDAPFEKGVLKNPNSGTFDFLPKATGITINKVHGYTPSIQQFRNKYHVDVETMESAAVFLACLQTKTDFLSIRSISNYVESRNRKAWKLKLAIDNLNKVLIQIIEGLA